MEHGLKQRSQIRLILVARQQTTCLKGTKGHSGGHGRLSRHALTELSNSQSFGITNADLRQLKKRRFRGSLQRKKGNNKRLMEQYLDSSTQV